MAHEPLSTKPTGTHTISSVQPAGHFHPMHSFSSSAVPDVNNSHSKRIPEELMDHDALNNPILTALETASPMKMLKFSCGRTVHWTGFWLPTRPRVSRKSTHNQSSSSLPCVAIFSRRISCCMISTDAWRYRFRTPTSLP